MKKTAILGASSIFAGNVDNLLLGRPYVSASASQNIDIAVVNGDDYFKNTVQAVELLGGMSQFVSKGSTVGLLVNSPWKNPGTFTNPSVPLAVIKMCFEAGAKEVWSIEGADSSYWRRSDLAEEYSEEIGSLKSSSDYVSMDIPKGKSLKKADIKRSILECDVLINTPIVKDHDGTRFTGCLKNIMGSTARETNQFFHVGDTDSEDFYGNVNLLSQCIADVNTLRKPDLCITDATEMVVTNGPAGPGKLITPKKIVAGVDRVAVDAYSATVLGLEAKNVLMIKMAAEHGLGEMQLDKLQIKELT